MIVTKSLYWIRSQSAGWWKSLPAFTGETDTPTQRKRHQRVSPAQHTAPAGKAGCAHPVGLGLIKPAGLAVRPRALPGGPTITPAGREDTKHSMQRREASESSTVFPARLCADKLYKPSKARLLGFKRDNLGSHCTVGFTEQEV